MNNKDLSVVSSIINLSYNFFKKKVKMKLFFKYYYYKLKTPEDRRH